MRSRLSILFLVSAVLLLSPDRVFASDVPERASLRAVGASEAIPFQLYQGYVIVVQGSAGPLKHLNFFLDTGTSSAVLDARIASKLNLQGEESASVVRLDSRMPGERTILPSIDIGPVERSNLQIVTADLSFFRKVIPVRVDAIVGLDVLGKRPFVIDYSARVIRFGPAPALPVVVPLRLDRGLAVFDAEIDHAPVHLLFDTGAGSMILFNSGGSPVHGSTGPESMMGGKAENKPVRLGSLKLGREEFRRKAALLALNPKPSQIDFDGLMSPAALGISRVSVDVQAGVLGFSR